MTRLQSMHEALAAMTYPAIDTLLPQRGVMVLLDEVLEHDDRRILCRATTHRNPAHPLAWDACLPVWAGIEYAAQAMAAHYCLLGQVRGESTLGLLGALRDVTPAVGRLDDIEEALLVAVERLSHDAAGSIYAFRVTGESSGRELLSGRATVVQKAGLGS